jgi:anti-sigma factor RsiW
MTSAPISERDLERLSAHIDGQLSASETADLQARLAAEPELKQMLQELSWTATGLKNLPVHPAPRPYRLTPEMVGQAAPVGRLPALRLATAVVGLALVAVVGLDAIQATGGSRLAGLPMAAQAPLAEDASQAAGAVGEAGAANSQLAEGGQVDETPIVTPEEALRSAVAGTIGPPTPSPEIPPLALAAPSQFEATPTPPAPEAFANSADQVAQAGPPPQADEGFIRLSEILLGVAFASLIIIQVRRRG